MAQRRKPPAPRKSTKPPKTRRPSSRPPAQPGDEDEEIDETAPAGKRAEPVEVPSSVIDKAVAGAGRDGKPDEEKDPTEGKETKTEEQAVKSLLEIIKKDVKAQDDKAKEWVKLRNKIVLSEGDDDNRKQVNVKLLLATLGAMVPHVYAQDPEISVRPSESVDPMRYHAMKAFSRTAEIVIARDMKEGEMEPQGKRTVRSGLTCGMGWIKVGTQTINGRDPVIERDIEDARQLMANVQAQIDVVKDDQGKQENEAEKARLTDMIQSLEAQAEVVISKGFTYDVVPPEDMIVAADLREMVDYRWARRITHRIWMTVGDACATFQLKEEQIKAATRFSSRHEDTKISASTQGNGAPDTNPEAEGQWLAVYETWDKDARTVYTTIDGYEHYARAPYSPKLTSRRWFPFFMWAVNFVDGVKYPVSDVENWAELQDEYNRTRSNESVVRKRSIPARIFNGGLIDPKDAEKFKDPSINELLAINAPPDVPLSNLIAALPNPAMDMKLYDTSSIRADLEQLTHLQDAQRAYMGRPKTATEAEIWKSGSMTSLSEYNITTERFVGEIGKHMLEVGLQMYTPADIVKIAGPGAVWPDMNLDEVYSLLDVDVRPGSSGRPNKLEEQQTWSVLAPIVEKNILTIAQLYAQGAVPVAQAMEELLRETFRRADERLDPDDFIPKLQPPQPQQPVAPGASNANPPPQATGPGPSAGPSVTVGADGRIVPLTVEPAGWGPRIGPGELNPSNLGA